MDWWVKKEERAEEIWSYDKQLLEALIRSLEEGAIVYDKDFKILSLNKSAEEILDIGAADVVGQIFSLEKARQFKSRVMAQAMFPSLAPVIVKKSEPGAYPQVIDVTTADPEKELTIITNQITDQQGRVSGFLKVIKDRTREMELLRSKSEFITIAAHQLRTPTSGLGWAFETLKKDLNLSEESKEVVNIGFKTSQTLLKIVNDLINVSQLEEGKFGYHLERMNLLSFMEKLLLDADVIAKEYKIKLYFERPSEKEIWINGDATRLGLAISNIIDNAIKYNVPNGQVVAAVCKVEASYVQISIKDTGVGIPEDELSRLFTKFFRAKNIEKYGVEGSGLGLYLTKNIIDHHGGKIWAESVVGRGSTFYINLPIIS